VPSPKQLAQFLETAEDQAGKQFFFMARWIGLLWLIEGIDHLTGQQLQTFGIVPLDPMGLLGIPLAPFLHGDVTHLISNTTYLVVLGWLMLATGLRRFWMTSILVTVISGFGIWFFGPPGSPHVGASALVFGYLGFLLLHGFFRRSLVWILISIVVILAYGGTVWLMLPSNPQISWLGHLLGFGAGLLAAWIDSTLEPRKPAGTFTL